MLPTIPKYKIKQLQTWNNRNAQQHQRPELHHNTRSCQGIYQQQCQGLVQATALLEMQDVSAWHKEEHDPPRLPSPVPRAEELLCPLLCTAGLPWARALHVPARGFLLPQLPLTPTPTLPIHPWSSLCTRAQQREPSIPAVPVLVWHTLITSSDTLTFPLWFLWDSQLLIGTNSHCQFNVDLLPLLSSVSDAYNTVIFQLCSASNYS